LADLLRQQKADLRSGGNWWTNLMIQRTNATIVMAVLASLLNVVCAYDPIGYGLPYNYVLFADTREALVETCLQVLLVLIDYCYPISSDGTMATTAGTAGSGAGAGAANFDTQVRYASFSFFASC